MAAAQANPGKYLVLSRGGQPAWQAILVGSDSPAIAAGNGCSQ